MQFLQRSVMILGLAACTVPSFAQELRNEGPVPTQATISVESKTDAPVDPALMKVEVNGHATPLTSLTKIQGSSAQIAILIDDGLRTSFDLQLRDLKKFIGSLPDGAQVLVGYMRNGTIVGERTFSADHAAVAGSLRIPLGEAGVSASPYFCLSDFVKHWPTAASGSRFVLMLTNGVDPYNGSVSVLNQDSPYVQTAQEDAERAGAAVYAIYYGQNGVRGNAASFSGQNYLEQVAHATGGQSLYYGSFNPVDLTPFLKQFNSDIRESYTATFMASTAKEKPHTLTRLKITTSQPGLKIHAPDGVHPGLETEQ